MPSLLETITTGSSLPVAESGETGSHVVNNKPIRMKRNSFRVRVHLVELAAVVIFE